ncbi:paraquat-inducible protein A [Thalassotalea aquiviva]|uniref:paraquat-inducible protein A n=1 Tax=Thalassotalea aquiviva TaxID=3242415 RepID=UPI00352BB737
MKEKLYACLECDYLLTLPHLLEGETAFCPRCRHPIVQRKINSINRTLAVCCSGLLIFIPAVFEPLMSMKILSLQSSASLFTGMIALWQSEMYLVSSLIFFFCIFTPLVKLSCAFVICVGVKFQWGYQMWFKKLFLYYHRADVWEMLEVFMIGVLVAIFKLKDLADLTLNFGILCFATLVVCVNALKVTLDHDMVWDTIDYDKG